MNICIYIYIYIYIRRPARATRRRGQAYWSYWSYWSYFPGLLVLLSQTSIHLARILGLCGHVTPSSRFPPRPQNPHVCLPGGGCFPSWEFPDFFIHPDASKTKWLGEVIFDSDGGHFIFDASGCIKNLGTPRTGRHHPRGGERVAFGGVGETYWKGENRTSRPGNLDQ